MEPEDAPRLVGADRVLAILAELELPTIRDLVATPALRAAR